MMLIYLRLIKREEVLLCECKFRNKPMPMEEYDDLVMAAEMFKKCRGKVSYVFSANLVFTESVKERAARENAVLLTIERLVLESFSDPL